MDDDDLRDFFAAFAMFKMTWHRGYEEEDAKDCYFIADRMLQARKKEKVGIAAIKLREKK